MTAAPDDDPGSVPGPVRTEEAMAARDDIYRVVALLWQLDRLYHPVAARAPGDFRVVVDPPALLPPTGVPGFPTDQAATAWAPEPPRRPAPALPPVRGPWVEQAANLDAVPQAPLPEVHPPPPEPVGSSPAGPPAAGRGQAAAPPELPQAAGGVPEAAPQVQQPVGERSRADPVLAGSGDVPAQQANVEVRRGPEGAVPGMVTSAADPPTEASAGLPGPQPPRRAGRPLTPDDAAPVPPPAAIAPREPAAAAPVPVEPGVVAGAAPAPPPAAGMPGIPAPQAERRPGRETSSGAAAVDEPRALPEPVSIVPGGRFSPSPSPTPAAPAQPAAEAAPPAADGEVADDVEIPDDLDDWDPDPLPDPGQRRDATVMRRGRASGSLTRTQAARLEEELRRRFRDRPPGGTQ